MRVRLIAQRDAIHFECREGVPAGVQIHIWPAHRPVPEGYVELEIVEPQRFMPRAVRLNVRDDAA